MARRKSVHTPVLWWSLCGAFLAGSYFVSAQSSFPAWVASILPDDRILHFLEFGALSVILCVALRGTVGKAPSLLVAVLALFCAGLWALADEYHQSFVPGRRGLLSECLIDIIGAIAGIALWITAAVIIREKRAVRGLP